LFGVDFVVPHPNPDWLKGTGEGVQGAEAWFNGSVDKLLPGTIPAGDRGASVAVVLVTRSVSKGLRTLRLSACK
jgi:hypothetical protein